MQDFSEAADTLGSMNLSEGWSSLSLRSRHSESGAQSAERRDKRGNEFDANRSAFDERGGSDDDEEEHFSSAQASFLHCMEINVLFAAPLSTGKLLLYDAIRLT